MSRRKIDKILNNNFEEMEYNPYPIMFTETGDTDSQEDHIYDTVLFDEIHKIITESEYSIFNMLDVNGDAPKLNKVQTNKIYSYVTSNLNVNFKKIEIWSILTEYYDMTPVKFYSYLSNVFKNELLEELQNNPKYLSRISKSSLKII